MDKPSAALTGPTDFFPTNNILRFNLFSSCFLFKSIQCRMFMELFFKTIKQYLYYRLHNIIFLIA